MNNRKCFECGSGIYHKVRENFSLTTQDGDTLEVPSVIRWKCDHCGDEVLPPESSRQIEDWIAEREERFTPSMIDDFLDSFRTDQTNAAIALGLGLKTFNRWSKGTQQVSRSMGYYLRALREFPEVFEWIKQRCWRHEVSQQRAGGYFITMGAQLDQERFPSLARALDRKRVVLVEHPRTWNPALELCCSPRR